MDLIDKKVVHKSFGTGDVIEQDEKFITIRFQTEKKKFIYPDAFGKFLKLEDRAAAASLKEVITEIEEEQEKQRIEEEKEKELKLLEQQRIEEHKKRMKNHKLHDISQLVFWLDEEDKDVFSEWQVFTGEIRSGKNKGNPNKAVRLHQNSAIILTERTQDQKEKERKIKGIYMVNETFIGKLADDGIIPAHSKYKMELTEKEADQMLFWNYYINEKYPDRMTWNTGKFRYFNNLWAAQILKDIISLKKDPKEIELAEEFLAHFCKMNMLEVDEIEAPSGALKQ